MAHNAPGKHFREGISLVEIIRTYPDDETSERWFTQIRWPHGPHCPYCGSVDVLCGAKHKTMPYRCREKECGKRFSVRTKSVMESSKLGYQKWAIAFYLFASNLKGVSSMKLHRDLGITQKSAWFMAHRIREAWHENRTLFAGPIEADETYIGGKESNKHSRKRLRAGRGTVGKTAVVGAKDRNSNHIVARSIESPTGPALKGFIADLAKPGATVYTDAAKAYRGMPFNHEVVNHSTGEYVLGMAHTNGIESFWSMLKRGVNGVFHHVSAKHLDRYVNEFSGRHNDRQRDTIDQMTALAEGMVGKRLSYRDLTA